MSVIKDIEEMSAYYLANLAECGSPDDGSSPGACFLIEIRDGFLEAVSDLEDDESIFDRLSYVTDHGQHWEMVQNAIDYRTHSMWGQFVDLQGYLEELESEPETTDMNELAGYALYQIGNRLFYALMSEVENSGEFDSE